MQLVWGFQCVSKCWISRKGLQSLSGFKTWLAISCSLQLFAYFLTLMRYREVQSWEYSIHTACAYSTSNFLYFFFFSQLFLWSHSATSERWDSSPTFLQLSIPWSTLNTHLNKEVRTILHYQDSVFWDRNFTTDGRGKEIQWNNFLSKNYVLSK